MADDYLLMYKLELPKTGAHCKIVQNFREPELGVLSEADVNVLLLHGYTGNSADMVTVSDYVLRHWFSPNSDSGSIRVRFIMPDAPYLLGKHSRSWWNISSIELIAGFAAIRLHLSKYFDPGCLDRSSSYVASLLSELGVECDNRLVVAGFSQGSIVATDFSLKVEGRGPAALVIFSGAIFDRADWQTDARMKKNSLLILQTHGRQDRILDYSSAVELFSVFESSDVKDATFLTFSGGHTVARCCKDSFAAAIIKVQQQRYVVSASCPIKSRDVETKDIAYRQALPAAIRDGSIVINGCDFDALLEQPEVLDFSLKESISTSIFARGKLKYTAKAGVELERANRDVFLKMSFYARDIRRDNSAQVEREIYARIVSWLLNTQKSPNLISFFVFYTCANMNCLWNVSSRALAKAKPFTSKLITAVRTLKRKMSVELGLDLRLYDFSKLHILMLELGQGQSLKSMGIEKAFGSSAVQWFSFLVQMLHTLECFNRIGLRQNDMHLGNVYMEEGFQPHIILYFITETEYYAVPVHKLAKIMDFDMSYYSDAGSKIHPIINTRLEPAGENRCSSYGVCNQPNPKFDAFTLLYFLWKEEGLPAYVKEFIEDMISVQLLNTAFTSPGFLCKMNQAGQCIGNYVPSDRSMRSVYSMLQQVDSYLQRADSSAGRMLFSLPEFDRRYLDLLRDPCDFVATRVFYLQGLDKNRIFDALKALPLNVNSVKCVNFMLDPDSELKTSSRKGRAAAFAGGALAGLAASYFLNRPRYYGRYYYPRFYYPYPPPPAPYYPYYY